MTHQIQWQDFQKLDIRVGTVISVTPFPEARKPAYILQVDFGQDIGIKKSSAQITHRYASETLTGKQVMAVVNFSPKQIGPILSECLILGFHDVSGEVVLAVPDQDIHNGARLA